MTLYLTIALLGLLTCAVGLVLRTVMPGRTVIPLWLATGLSGLAVGLGMGCGLMYSLGYRWSGQAAPSWQPVFPPPPGSSREATITGATAYGYGAPDAAAFAQLTRAAGDDPLAPGSALPELAAEGWINGAPNPATGPRGNVRVVDVWADG